MNIYFHSLSNYALATFKEIILPTLTAQQKRICILASIALGCLFACYVANRYCFKAHTAKHRPEDSEDKASQIFRAKNEEELETLSESIFKQGKETAEEKSKIERINSSEKFSLQNEIKKGCDSLESLPEEMLIHIFKQLELANWESLLYTNKKFHGICLNPNLTNDLLEKNIIPHQNKKLILKLVEYSGSHLKKLNLENMVLTEEELKNIFCVCPKIKELNLRYAKFLDSTVDSVLEYLPLNLESLNLYGHKEMSAHGLQHLKALSLLQSLVLKNCEITDEDLEHLKQLSTLQSLNLSGCRDITDKGVEHLKNLSLLRSLNIRNTDITHKGLEHLKNLSQLQALDLSCCYDITPNGFFDHLKNFSCLQSLELERCAIDDDNLKNFKNFSFLQSLNLEECKRITDNGLEHLKDLTTLQFLNLSYCQDITDDGLQHLTHLSHLQSLELKECNITDKGLEYISSLSMLQSLNLFICLNITDKGLEHLKNLSHLQSLKLNNCPKITNDGLQHLKAFSHLRHLSLDNLIQITDGGVEHLKSLSLLESLHLCVWTKGITKENLQDLKKTLPFCDITQFEIF